MDTERTHPAFLRAAALTWKATHRCLFSRVARPSISREYRQDNRKSSSGTAEQIALSFLVLWPLTGLDFLYPDKEWPAIAPVLRG